LRSRHEPVCLLDQRAIEATTLNLVVGPTVQGTLRAGDETIALEAVTAVYARPYDVRQVPALEDAGPLSPLWQHGLALDDALLDSAAAIDANQLRSLDAIHLASAQQLEGELDVLVTYDERMLAAARALDLPVSVPA